MTFQEQKIKEFDEKFQDFYDLDEEGEHYTNIISFLLQAIQEAHELGRIETISAIKGIGATDDVDLVTVAKIINKLNDLSRQSN